MASKPHGKGLFGVGATATGGRGREFALVEYRRGIEVHTEAGAARVAKTAASSVQES